MNNEIAVKLSLLLERMEHHAKGDPVLRKILQEVAEYLLTISVEPTVSAKIETAIPVVNAPIEHPNIEAHEQPVDSQLKLKSKVSLRSPVVTGRTPSIRTEPRLITIPEQPVAQDDLQILTERLRIKAEGARWAAERERMLAQDIDYSAVIEPKDREIIFRARQLPDCFLWMCHRDGPTAQNKDDYATLAGCFDAAADIVQLLNKFESEPDGQQFIEKAMTIAAEAQSALRIIVNALDPRFSNYTDPDQFKLFNWLRNTCRDQQILIHRYMRLDDPADPYKWPEIRNKVEQLNTDFEGLKRRDKDIQQLFKKIEYRVKRLKPDSKDDPLPQWKAIVEHTDQLIDIGIQPSNPELREMLLPYIDVIPDLDEIESAKNFQAVLREIDRYLASMPDENGRIEEEQSAQISEGVRHAAELLNGRTVVLIGGDRRHAAAVALKKAFGLKELIWVEGRDQTYVEFEPQVARGDVSLVILAIRWSRHGFGEVKNFCEQYGKPLVRLPGGYNPNQVAFHVINQVGERLAASVQLEA